MYGIYGNDLKEQRVKRLTVHAQLVTIVILSGIGIFFGVMETYHSIN